MVSLDPRRLRFGWPRAVSGAHGEAVAASSGPRRGAVGTLKSTAPLSPSDPVASDAYEEARAALDRGEAERARELADRAYEQDPTDHDVVELYALLHLARAVRLAAAAREARRADIVRREIPYEETFEDTPDVARAFDRALAAVDDVLRADPRHEKALMTKAALLFRRDRESGRPQALEILRALLEGNPGNRQVAMAVKKVERPCPRCSDTGFCSDCRGRGSKRLLRIERKCESCHGQGICLLCGIL